MIWWESRRKTLNGIEHIYIWDSYYKLGENLKRNPTVLKRLPLSKNVHPIIVNLVTNAWPLVLPQIYILAHQSNRKIFSYTNSHLIVRRLVKFMNSCLFTHKSVTLLCFSKDSSNGSKFTLLVCYSGFHEYLS